MWQVNVMVRNKTLTLTETGATTGMFTGTVNTIYGASAGSNDDGTLATQVGDTVTASYTDNPDASGGSILRSAVGAGVNTGGYVNSTTSLFNGVAVGNTATATVQVVGDPNFDKTTMIGRYSTTAPGAAVSTLQRRQNYGCRSNWIRRCISREAPGLNPTIVLALSQLLTLQQ